MDKVSPAPTEMQHVETASWNGSSQPPTPIDSVEITTTSPCGSNTDSDVYTVTLDANLSRRSESGECESGECEPLSPGLHENATEEEVVQNANPFNSSQSENEDASPTKRIKTSPGKSRKPGSNISVTLEGADLWHQFYSAGTEMIITKSGRRMFPGIVLSISGLDPDAKYIVTMEVSPSDNHRYKYLNSKWVVVGKADAYHPDLQKYVHPDSPANGKHWMANKISFKKIKVTNNKNSKRDNVTLNSMHRYLPRVVISKCLSKKSSLVVHTQDFQECTFIAVTAYQNDQVTQLKIDHNPFAKAFRDNPHDQDMYGYHGMMGVWHPSSPLLSPYQTYQGDGHCSPSFIPSPGLQTPGHSPLPQFQAAFGTWESPPYSPATYQSQGSTAGPLPSPATVPLPDPRQFLWNASRLQQESPPISPLLYSPSMYPSQGANSTSVYQFPATSQTWQRPSYASTSFQASHSPVGYGPYQSKLVTLPQSQHSMAGDQPKIEHQMPTCSSPHEPMDL